MNLIRLGKVVLSSGVESDFKLECDRFIDENIDGLAFLIAKIIGPFSSAEGVPRGGLRLAESLSRHAVQPMYRVHEWNSSWTCNYCGVAEELMAGFGCPARPYSAPRLIVDDVLTTGGSMCRLRDELSVAFVAQDPRAESRINGAVVFARGKCPDWVRAVFQCPEELWVKKP